MKIKFTKNKIIIKKELNELDKFVIDSTLILDSSNIKYVIVSGYVAILFGRSRGSEDIDVIAERINLNKFRDLWENLYHSMECLNTKSINDAYSNYLSKSHAIRFSYKNRFIPNVEIKFPKNELDVWSIDNRKEIILNGYKFYTSPFELQIPYKLFLGSNKDIEDAKHMFNLFKEKLNLSLLNKFSRKLNIEKVFNRYLK